MIFQFVNLYIKILLKIYRKFLEDRNIGIQKRFRFVLFFFLYNSLIFLR